jgi:hypothetical protein
VPGRPPGDCTEAGSADPRCPPHAPAAQVSRTVPPHGRGRAGHTWLADKDRARQHGSPERRRRCRLSRAKTRRQRGRGQAAQRSREQVPRLRCGEAAHEKVVGPRQRHVPRRHDARERPQQTQDRPRSPDEGTAQHVAEQPAWRCGGDGYCNRSRKGLTEDEVALIRRQRSTGTSHRPRSRAAHPGSARPRWAPRDPGPRAMAKTDRPCHPYRAEALALASWRDSSLADVIKIV